MSYKHIDSFVLLHAHLTVMKVQTKHQVSVAFIEKSGWGPTIKCTPNDIVNLVESNMRDSVVQIFLIWTIGRLNILNTKIIFYFNSCGHFVQ